MKSHTQLIQPRQFRTDRHFEEAFNHAAIACSELSFSSLPLWSLEELLNVVRYSAKPKHQRKILSWFIGRLIELAESWWSQTNLYPTSLSFEKKILAQAWQVCATDKNAPRARLTSSIKALQSWSLAVIRIKGRWRSAFALRRPIAAEIAAEPQVLRAGQQDDQNQI